MERYKISLNNFNLAPVFLSSKSSLILGKNTVVTLLSVPLLLPTLFGKRDKIQFLLTHKVDTEDKYTYVNASLLFRL